MSRRIALLDFAAATISVLLLAIAVGAIGDIVFDPTKNFVHPNNWTSILIRSTANGLSVGWGDFYHAMDPVGLEESRPRFLAYLIEGFDYKLRLFLDNYATIPPTFRPITWLLHVLVAPVLLFRLMRNLGGDRVAATVAVSVYLSSIGFLSGLSMALLPGKPLVTVSLLTAMYLLSTVAGEHVHQKFSQASPVTIVASLVTVFVGLTLDEVGLFAFVLLPIMFWPLFWDSSARPMSRRPDWKGIAICAIPALVFLFIVIVVMPPVYRYLYHQAFDYLGNALAYGVGALGSKSIFEGPHATFGLALIWQIFRNLLGVSVVPLQISPFVSRNVDDIFSLSQTENLAQLLGLGAFCGALVACAALRYSPAAWLRRTLLASAVFILLMTLLSTRWIPVITGYYYGASTSLFIALPVGLAVATLGRKGPAWRLAGVAAAALIVIVQIDNFTPIDSRWRAIHYDTARSIHAKQFNLSNTEVTLGELSTIRAAWKQGQLEQYLKSHEISVGAIYLVYELRTIDQLRGPSAK